MARWGRVWWIGPRSAIKSLSSRQSGKFLPAYDKHLVCIAGGSGVTPFRGFVREATRRNLHTKITVLYSVRAPKDIIFNQEFCALEKENPNFKFHGHPHPRHA